MVGRDTEIRRLRDTFGAAVGERSLRTVTIVGDAGVGKSRLTREFLASVGRRPTSCAGAACRMAAGITFWPLVEIVRSAAEIDDDDLPERARAKLRGLVGDEDVAERLASVTGLSASAFPLAETFWAVQRLVEMLSDRGPLVVVIDDIHSAEPTLLDLIEHVSEADLVVPVRRASRYRCHADDAAWSARPRVHARARAGRWARGGRHCS